MATVYLARDLKHRRPVAVKVLDPGLASGAGAQRFLREVETTATLHHPHILPLYDSGEVDGLVYYTMPLIEGGSLRDRLAAELQLPLDEALRIAREVGEALDHAHRLGVMHRDIKPENILLEHGHAVVADFGIARALAPTGGERLTGTGLGIGTPEYMSPEQAMASPKLDGRTDQYSLACVLYEMLAGAPPYSGPTAQAILARRLVDPVPSLRAARELAPPAVEEAIVRALSREPVDRFRTMAEFVAALGPPGATASGSAPAASATGGRSRWWLWVAGAVLLAVTIGAGLAVWRARRPPGGGRAPVIAVIPFENVGGPDDDDFADGMTQELTARLSGLQGLRVIGRASARRYAKTTKPIREIGRELHADYLLGGSVRWEAAASGPSRVRVTPELTRVADESQVWAGSFDAVLADVFQVQSDIASQVATHLDVTLVQQERSALVARPTESAQAYNLYLRASSYAEKMFSSPAQLRAVELYRAAIEADSGFARAWADLATVYEYLSWLHGRSDLLPAARAALARASALAPGSPEVHAARGYDLLFARDSRGALAEFQAAIDLKPNDPGYLMGRSFARRRLGEWEGSVADVRQALALDPKNRDALFTLGESDCLLRRYRESDQATLQAIALDTADAGTRRQLALCRVLAGDTAAAAAAVREAGAIVPPGQALGGTPALEFGLLVRVLAPSAPDLIGRVSLKDFEGDSLGYYLLRLEHSSLTRPDRRQLAVADSARRFLEAALAGRLGSRVGEAVPRELELALVYGLLGRRAEAERLAREALAAVPVARDAFAGPQVEIRAAEVFIRIGELDEAIGLLEQALAVPSPLSQASLRLDPLYRPLRGHPRFERLMAAPGQSAPAP